MEFKMQVSSKKVVIVLGAGASCHLGYPSGLQLREEIVSLAFGSERSEIWKYLKEDQFSEFREKFSKSGNQSIDAFLAKNSKYVEIAGKIIFYCLSKHIGQKQDWRSVHEDAKGNLMDNWYLYFFSEILTKGFNQISDLESRLNISVVNFNYDLTFDDFLWTALNASYPDNSRCLNIVNKMGLWHVHDKIWKRIWEPNWTQYSPVVMQELISNSKGISFGFNNPNGEERWIPAVREADVICFLGFGYHIDNVQKLFPTGIDMSKNELFKKPVRLIGNVKGMGEGEKAISRGVIPGKEIELIEGDCLNALKHFKVALT